MMDYIQRWETAEILYTLEDFFSTVSLSSWVMGALKKN
jgi:hypothetical protein